MLPEQYIYPVKATLSLSQGNTDQQRLQQTQDPGSSQHAARPSHRHTHADLAQHDHGNDATRWTQPSATAAHLPPPEPATADAEPTSDPMDAPMDDGRRRPPHDFCLDCDTPIEHGGDHCKLGRLQPPMAGPNPPPNLIYYPPPTYQLQYQPQQTSPQAPTQHQQPQHLPQPQQTHPQHDLGGLGLQGIRTWILGPTVSHPWP